MTAHVAKDGMSFLLPSRSRTVTARRPGAISRRLAAAAKWLVEMPRRRAVLESLSGLSDHELADIGLTRSDLPRVFDPSFTACRNAVSRAGN